MTIITYLLQAVGKLTEKPSNVCLRGHTIGKEGAVSKRIKHVVTEYTDHIAQSVSSM